MSDERKDDDAPFQPMMAMTTADRKAKLLQVFAALEAHDEGLTRSQRTQIAGAMEVRLVKW